MTSTYLSSDDSRLLRQELSSVHGDACLEIGVGYGSNLVEISNRFKLAVGTDLKKTEAMLASDDDSVQLVITDTASCFRDSAFDLVIFNPPYLPSEQIVDISVDGGKDGLDVPKMFLEEALRVVRPKGQIFVVLSSECSMSEFNGFCKKLKVCFEVVARKKLFFEEIYVFRLSRE
jgi:release factor glutamine methyltransferase